ncbi:peroxisome proliferator-activated receptor gamma [Striga asiatica]|uniref:Peroxisome proliferator-activated receptor gamma n=1 Tax=Striga asiatica TaxID=4170 RepID=A0A5A7Q0U7_STRAF|nr:peroxisome proliferator-activated receptor gamma [Striga asiatica]
MSESAPPTGSSSENAATKQTVLGKLNNRIRRQEKKHWEIIRFEKMLSKGMALREAEKEKLHLKSSIPTGIDELKTFRTILENNIEQEAAQKKNHRRRNPGKTTSPLVSSSLSLDKASELAEEKIPNKTALPRVSSSLSLDKAGEVVEENMPSETDSLSVEEVLTAKVMFLCDGFVDDYAEHKTKIEELIASRTRVHIVIRMSNYVP